MKVSDFIEFFLIFCYKKKNKFFIILKDEFKLMNLEILIKLLNGDMLYFYR